MRRVRGRAAGKGGETIRRLQEETGCRDRHREGFRAVHDQGNRRGRARGAAAVRRQIEDGDGGGRGGFRGRGLRG